MATLEFSSKPSNVKIMLVDCGEIIYASLHQLYPILEQFCVEPAVGLLCTLSHIKAPSSKGWGMEEFSFFSQECSQTDALNAIFLRCPQNETFTSFTADFVVRLEKKMAGRTLDIGTLMIDNGKAKRSEEECPIVTESPSTRASTTQSDCTPPKCSQQPITSVVAHASVPLIPPQEAPYPKWSDKTMPQPAIKAISLLDQDQQAKKPSSTSVHARVGPSGEKPKVLHPSNSLKSPTKLNVNAPEFVFPSKTAPPAARSCPPGDQAHRGNRPSPRPSLKSDNSKPRLPADPAPRRPMEGITLFKSPTPESNQTKTSGAEEDCIDVMLKPPSSSSPDDPESNPSGKDILYQLIYLIN